MAMSRRALLLRLAIYGPLLTYFGWQAWGRYQAGRAAERRAAERKARIDRVLREQTQTVTLPDGTTREVHVLTPEQAEEIWGVRTGDPDDASARDPGAAQAAPTPAPSGDATGPAAPATIPPVSHQTPQE